MRYSVFFFFLPPNLNEVSGRTHDQWAVQKSNTCFFAAFGNCKAFKLSSVPTSKARVVGVGVVFRAATTTTTTTNNPAVVDADADATDTDADADTDTDTDTAAAELLDFHFLRSHRRSSQRLNKRHARRRVRSARKVRL